MVLSELDETGFAAALGNDLLAIHREFFICKEQTGGLQSRQLAALLFKRIAIGQHVEHFETAKPVRGIRIRFVCFEQSFKIHHGINSLSLPSSS